MVRRTRPEPKRVEPNRRWNGASTSSPKGAESSQAAAGQTEPDHGDRERADPRQAAYEAVNDAYSVIDEYMRQGQRMAERLWMPMMSASEGLPNPLAAPERLMRAVGDMTMAWMEIVQQLGQPNANPPQASGTAGPFTAGKRPDVRTEPENSEVDALGNSLSLRVTATGRVEASVQLPPHTDPARLVLGELRSFSADGPPITTATLTSNPGQPVELRIDVPEGQPAGVYSGILLERDSQRPKGTVTLTVL
jgi:hypothetical protein